MSGRTTRRRGRVIDRRVAKGIGETSATLPDRLSEMVRPGYLTPGDGKVSMALVRVSLSADLFPNKRKIIFGRGANVSNKELFPRPLLEELLVGSPT